jgi:alpha-ketoglutarate-dependent taurine dioxygenase
MRNAVVDFEDSGQIQRVILPYLSAHGVAVMRLPSHFRSDDALMDFARHFGVPQPHSTVRKPGSQRASEHEFVFNIAVREQPAKSLSGDSIISQTNADFDWHTDEFFLAEPADVVLLHCLSADDKGGGISMVANVHDALSELSGSQIDILMRPLFPHSCGLAPILLQTDIGFNVRYNASYIRKNALLTDEVKAALSAFEHAINSRHDRFLLQENECLIVDNLRILHGRTNFSPHSPRHLKRVRTRMAGWSRSTWHSLT